jgi:hypothetical protein
MDEIQIGKILHQALRVVAMYPLLFILVDAITHIDMIRETLWGLAGVRWSFGSGMPTDAQGWSIAEGVSDILGLMVAPISFSITCHIVSQVMHGKTLSVRDAIQSGPRRYTSVLGVIVVVDLRILLGSLLLIVPGIIIAIKAAAATPACILENLPPFESARRSTLLTDGNRMKILYLFLIPILGAAPVFGLVLVLEDQVDGTILAFVNLFASSMLYAYLTVLTIVLYYHLRALKEGLEVPQLARRTSDPE